MPRKKLIIKLLCLVLLTVWLSVFFYPEKRLKIIACDVGQGDATLAIYGKTQILIDGGPNNKVIDCLSRYMPFWDRKIEVVVLTHPQDDHYKGLIEVFRRFDVDVFAANSLDSSTQGYELLKSIVGGSGAKVINPTTGMVIRLGMIYLDIVHPSREFITQKGNYKEGGKTNNVLGSYVSRSDPNEFSIVIYLKLDEFDALLTGDIGPDVIDYISERNLWRDVEYIKIPHHGSKNGLTENLLNQVMPEIAVISVGKENSYGHPHKSVIDLLKEKNVLIKRTDEDGNIEFATDGEVWEIK